MNCRSTSPWLHSWAQPGMPLDAAAGYCIPQVVRPLSQLQSGNSPLQGGQKQLPKSSHACHSASTAHEVGLPPTPGTRRDALQTRLCLMGMASEELGSKLEPRSKSDMSCNFSKCNGLLHDPAFSTHPLSTALKRGSMYCVLPTSHLPAIPPKHQKFTGTLQLHSSAALSHSRVRTEIPASWALFKGMLKYPLTQHQKNQC